MLVSENVNDVTVLELMTEANLSAPKRYVFSVFNEGIYAIQIYIYIRFDLFYDRTVSLFSLCNPSQFDKRIFVQ